MESCLLWQKDAKKPILSSHLELAALLNFHYLDKLAFKEEEFQSVLEKGIKKQEAKQVLPEQLAFGKKFKNKIEESFLPPTSVRWCGEKIGWGLFAEASLDRGAFIGEYTGRVRKNDEHTSVNNYLYEYPIPDYIGRSYVIDATEGNLIRFVNHSERPNLKPVYAFYEGLYHLILVAAKKIEIGEQLTYDYGRTYWYVRSPPMEN